MTRIQREYTFDSAHRLPRHKGKCARPHGHTWRVKVCVQGPIQEESGMVLDFQDLDAVVDPLLEGCLDHTDLNQTFRSAPPTAENIARFIFHYVAQLLETVTVYSVEVWETPKSSVLYLGEERDAKRETLESG